MSSDVPDAVLADRVRAGDLRAFETLYQRTAAGEARVALYLNGPGDERVIPVHGTLFVGRECAGVPADERLILDDPSVSRVHLEFKVDGARVHVTDHSRNGTLLNGAEMPAGTPIVLLDGDTLRVGPTSLMLRTDLTNTIPRPAPAAPVTPAADVTAIAYLPAITAVATSPADVPDELVDRLIAAAALFGGIADRMPGSLVMVRWTLSAADGEKQCARFLDFAKLLAGNLPIDWSLLRG